MVGAAIKKRLEAIRAAQQQREEEEERQRVSAEEEAERRPSPNTCLLYTSPSPRDS